MQILKEEIREKILSVAEKIFLKRGFDKTTMREIAIECDISVGNIYRYFENKDGILDAIIGNFGKELKEFGDYADYDAYKNTSQEKVDLYVNRLAELFEKNRTAISILSQENSNKKLKQFENLIILDISKRIMNIAGETKEIKCNELLVHSIAKGALEGIKSVILLSDRKDKKQAIENISRYLKFTSKDLINRLKEI